MIIVVLDGNKKANHEGWLFFSEKIRIIWKLLEQKLLEQKQKLLVQMLLELRNRKLLEQKLLQSRKLPRNQKQLVFHQSYMRSEPEPSGQR